MIVFSVRRWGSAKNLLYQPLNWGDQLMVEINGSMWALLSACPPVLRVLLPFQCISTVAIFLKPSVLHLLSLFFQWCLNPSNWGDQLMLKINGTLWDIFLCWQTFHVSLFPYFLLISKCIFCWIDTSESEDGFVSCGKTEPLNVQNILYLITSCLLQYLILWK